MIDLILRGQNPWWSKIIVGHNHSGGKIIEGAKSWVGKIMVDRIILFRCFAVLGAGSDDRTNRKSPRGVGDWVKNSSPFRPLPPHLNLS